MNLLCKKTEFGGFGLVGGVENLGHVPVVNDCLKGGAECLVGQCLNHETFVVECVAEVLLKLLIASR